MTKGITIALMFASAFFGAVLGTTLTYSHAGGSTYVAGGGDATQTGSFTCDADSCDIDADRSGTADAIFTENGTEGTLLSAGGSNDAFLSLTGSNATLRFDTGTEIIADANDIEFQCGGAATFDLATDGTAEFTLTEEGTDGVKLATVDKFLFDIAGSASQFELDVASGGATLEATCVGCTTAIFGRGTNDSIQMTANGGQFVSGGAQQGGYNDNGVFVGIGAAPDATCTAGTIFIDTDQTDDTNCTTTSDNSLCLCTAANTWVELDNN